MEPLDSHGCTCTGSSVALISAANASPRNALCASCAHGPRLALKAVPRGHEGKGGRWVPAGWPELELQVHRDYVPRPDVVAGGGTPAANSRVKIDESKNATDGTGAPAGKTAKPEIAAAAKDLGKELEAAK